MFFGFSNHFVQTFALCTCLLLEGSATGTRERPAHRAGWARVGSGGSLRDELAGCHDLADVRDLQEAMISPDSNDVVVPACEAA